MKRRQKAPARIGIFGGTFDPIHVGHLVIAETAREQLGLAKVIFMTAAVAPHKRGTPATPAIHRLAMVRTAIRGSKALHASDLEVRNGGVSYTVDTVRFLSSVFPGKELWLIMGSDNLKDFSSWKEPGELLRLCRVAVYERPGYPVSPRSLKRTKAVVLEGGIMDVSATLLRKLQSRGRSIQFLVPSSVERYIQRHRLYGRGRR
jgi:nicotinate-nucleotide adenylyltransferase